ncbi:MAG TPA: hypothetical protein PLQ95_04380 [Thiobacillus sp.]|nr:hypothetical protein [Thiobacillus sp.]
MSKYLQFDENGLPVDSFSQPKAAADSIFKTHEVKQENRHDSRGATTAKAVGLTLQLHAIRHQGSDSGEPDWQGMLLQAKTGRAKWEIRAAREAWQDEQRTKAVMQVMAEQDAHNQEVIQRPNRNKEFYDDLRMNDPRAYWSVPVQRQMKTDRANMGLAFHLKNRNAK